MDMRRIVSQFMLLVILGQGAVEFVVLLASANRARAFVAAPAGDVANLVSFRAPGFLPHAPASDGSGCCSSRVDHASAARPVHRCGHCVEACFEGNGHVCGMERRSSGGFSGLRLSNPPCEGAGRGMTGELGPPPSLSYVFLIPPGERFAGPVPVEERIVETVGEPVARSNTPPVPPPERV